MLRTDVNSRVRYIINALILRLRGDRDIWETTNPVRRSLDSILEHLSPLTRLTTNNYALNENVWNDLAS